MKMAKEISRLLAQRAVDVVSYLLPNGKKEGPEWRAGSIDGEPGKSFGVHLSGNKAGMWCDFSNPADKGDLLDLWAAVRKISLREAIKEAGGYLGLTATKFYGHRPQSFSRPSQKDAPGAQRPDSPVMAYLRDERKLTHSTLEAFRIGERGRDIVFPYSREGELVFVKYISLDRPAGKKKVSVTANCEPCLFGWDVIPANARVVTLCEGEIDAMSLYQYGIPALSLPFGGGAGDKQKWVQYEFDRLAMFDVIFLCIDNDAVGNAAVAELVERLGRHRCRLARLPKHDANDCLVAGVSGEEIRKCFDDACTLDPEELKPASQFVDQVIDVFYPPEGVPLGYQPPWEKAKKHILFRPSEFSIWTGINSHGKSQFLGHVILAAMRQGARVCIASLELKPGRLLYRLTRQAGALASPTEGYIRAIHEWYGDKLWLFDLVGTAKSTRLLDVFLYARQRYGIDVFVIDSFLKLDIAEDDFARQKSFLEQLCDFKNQHGCHIHLVVHPRKGADEAKAPGKLDCKGTGAVSDLADNCFTVWRNKEKEKVKKAQEGGKTLDAKQTALLDTPDCFWFCDKQRNGDWEGSITLWFHPDSYQYLGYSAQKPVQFVNYSSTNP